MKKLLMLGWLGTYRWALVASLGSGLVGCGGSSVTRVVSVPGYAPEEISMSEEDAAIVDQMVADEPTGADSEKCTYWKQKMSEVPPGNSGAVTYAQKQGGGLCAKSR